MLMWWRIRYLDTRDKQFKDRDLWLNTDDLEATTKVALEALYALRETGRIREMMRYRPLFHEKTATKEELHVFWHQQGGRGSILIHDYFEDEVGQELNYKRMAVSLTGNPDSDFFPPGTTQHDIDYHRAEKRPIELGQVNLSVDQLNVLGYFTRDLRELLESAFFKDGPGTLNGPWSDGHCRLLTAVSDEEIRSFVTIFRRLYMTTEPANFVKTVTVFSTPLSLYPLAKWVQGVGMQYERELQVEPAYRHITGKPTLSFSRKRLIDVFLYTQYAHQPDQKRADQFRDCLTDVGGDSAILTWLFFTEIWHCSIHMYNAGNIIAGFYDAFCQHNNVTGEILTSVRTEHSGLGTLEKKAAQESRILKEKAEELAKALWESAGRPEAGYSRFLNQALELLESETGSKPTR